MFYHAVHSDVTAVLFELLKKSLKQKKRCLVVFDNLDYAQAVSDRLWAFQKDYILPHGLLTENMPHKQLILLTDRVDNRNNSDYIFFIGVVTIADFESFERCIVIFDDYSDSTKIHMRMQFKALKERNIPLRYYQQIQGIWQSKI